MIDRHYGYDSFVFLLKGALDSDGRSPLAVCLESKENDWKNTENMLRQAHREQVKDIMEITSLQRTLFRDPNAFIFSYVYIIHHEPLKSRQPLYKGQNGWYQRVLCLEVPL